MTVLEVGGIHRGHSAAAPLLRAPALRSRHADGRPASAVEILESLRDDIEAGTPIVGLEPSCVSVFRDELLRFFPDDPLARKLSQQALFLTEFLVKTGSVPDWRHAGTGRRRIRTATSGRRCASTMTSRC